MAFRLTVLVVSAATLPALTLGLLVIRSGQTGLEREILTRNREVARLGAEKVESSIDGALDKMRLLSKAGVLTRGEPAQTEALLSIFVRVIQEIDEIALVDANGRERVRLSESALITAEDLGTQAGSTALEVALGGKEYVGPVRASSYGEPFVTLALPVEDLSEGRVTGVLVAQLNLKGLWEAVLDARVGKEGYLYLVDETGRLIAHPDFSMVLAQRDVREFRGVQHFLTAAPNVATARAAEYPNYQGREVLGVFARSPKLGWGVIVEQPTSDALSHVREVRVNTAVVLLNTLVVAILLSVLAARRLSGPLQELGAGAAAVGAGELSTTIPVRAQDEIGEVARGFNWMTANLRKSFGGMRVLLDGTTRLAGATERQEVVQLAIDEARRVVGNVHCAVLLWEANAASSTSMRAEIWHEDGRPGAAAMLRLDEDHPVARAFASGEVIACRAGMLGLPGAAAGDPEASALVVPLGTGPQVQGALVVVRSVEAQEFDDAEVVLCRTLANHVSTALQLRAAHDQLMRSQRLRTVGEVAAGVAHNFNNVLAGILGRAQLLQRIDDAAAVRHGLGVIEQAALDGAGIVRRLQDSARLRSGAPLAAVTVTKVVQDALELTRPCWKDAAELRAAPITVETVFGDLPIILGDAGEFREVATNIILNAVEAMPSGGSLRIEAVVAGNWVTLSFRDTGIGMTDDIQRRIFDPFFTTKGTQGTGLGMSLSYAIVRRHGGDITVDSALGSGTTVHVRLPATRLRTPGASAETGTSVSSASRRILVADDDGYVRGVLRDVLTSLGHRVDAVDSGQQALERVAGDAFDLVITDLGMEVSGREVARAVKARSPSTPVIVVTGWAANLDPTELQAVGVDAILAKPFQLHEVRELVERLSARTTLA